MARPKIHLLSLVITYTTHETQQFVTHIHTYTTHETQQFVIQIWHTPVLKVLIILRQLLLNTLTPVSHICYS